MTVIELPVQIYILYTKHIYFLFLKSPVTLLSCHTLLIQVSNLLWTAHSNFWSRPFTWFSFGNFELQNQRIYIFWHLER